MSDQSTTVTGANRPTTDTRVRNPFFVGMAGALLLIVLLGFSPTLYLRAYFDVPEMPAYVLVHGAVLTVWFVWFFIQTSLVAVHRTDLHRRLGIVGAGIGVAVVAASMMGTFGFVPRLTALGRDIEANIAGIAAGLWSNIGMVITFSTLLTLAIVNRGRSEIHKRLMLLASISILGPASARLGRISFLQVSESGIVNESVMAITSLLLLLLVLVLHDVRAQRRLHPVTMWGAPLVILVPFSFAFGVGNTAFGQSLVSLLN